MARQTKIDKLIETAKALGSEELVKLGEALKADKAKQKKKPGRKPKPKVVEVEETVITPATVDENRHSGPARFTRNRFQDDGTLEKLDGKFDQKYGDKFNTGPRSRPPVHFINVPCNRCSTIEKIPETLVTRADRNSPPYYICSKCAKR